MPLSKPSIIRNENDLGLVFKFQFKNCHKLTLQAYSWQVVSPKAYIILLHGVTSHVFYDFFYHNYPENVSASTRKEDIIENAYLTYERSFIQKMNLANISVFAYDQQGHGASQSLDDTPCYVESINDLVFDGLQYVLLIESLFNTSHNIPIYIGGISMGAAIALKVTQLYEYIIKKKALPLTRAYESLLNKHQKATQESAKSDLIHELIWPDSKSPAEIIEKCVEVQIHGVVALCPPINTGKVKRQWLNMLMLPFSDYAANKWPSWKVVSLSKNPMFPWMDYLKDKKDSLMYNDKLPTKMANELIRVGKSIQNDKELFRDSDNTSLRLLFVQSKLDDLVDASTTIKFVQELGSLVQQIKLIEPVNMWHYLTTEPGSEKLTDEIVLWLSTE